MSQRSSGDVRVEAKEGILYVQLTSEYVGECVEPRSDRHCDRAKGGSVLSHFLLFHFLPLYRHLRDKCRSMISPSAACTFRENVCSWFFLQNASRGEEVLTINIHTKKKGSMHLDTKRGMRTDVF